MVLKVKATVPLVWRTPSSLQFGVDAPLVVIDELDAGTERLLAALVGGISPSGLDMIAHSAGLAPDAAELLLTRLGPVMEQDAAPASPARVAVTGDGPLADELRRMLDADGVLADPGESAPGLAVIVAAWLVGAEDHGRWLRRDIPHLPVVSGDAGITIGPLVEPGAGPCLYCVQLARTDADPAWPAIATQLWSRPAPPLTALAVAEAAAFAARRIRERLDAGFVRGPVSTGSVSTGSTSEAMSWRLAAADGAISSRAWTRHAACRCAAPPGSDWAPAADPGIRSSTTTASAAAVPA